MRSDEHDDDLSTTVDERGDAETNDFPNMEEEFDIASFDAEADDEDIVGK